MENPIIIIENNALTTESANQIAELVKEQKRLADMLSNVKDELYKILVEEDIKQIKVDGLTINRIDPTSPIQFDEKRFKEEQTKLYNEYCKVGSRKGYAKIEVK